jgi:hypothetical protein
VNNIPQNTWEIFSRYVSELRNICASHTLSHSKSAMLTKEEAIIGTIVAKNSQPCHRKFVMANLYKGKNQASHAQCLTGVEGDDDISDKEQLSLAWAAWKLLVWSQEWFGVKSFGWIALGQVFEAISTIEEG